MPQSVRRILVVEDDTKTADLVSLYLERAGFQVYRAADGTTALESLRTVRPDLVILDLMLPGLDGWQVCQRLRAESDVPIIMLTARVSENDKLHGLTLGADDYVTKPFSPRELVARVQAVLRRSREAGPPGQIQVGDLVIDLASREVRLGHRRVSLTPAEFRILAVLASEPGRAFSRALLLERAFGYDFAGVDRNIDMHIMNLRRKLEDDSRRPRYIKTVYGLGYKLEAP
jgi:DNA-binding response OmpR family regulator